MGLIPNAQFNTVDVKLTPDDFLLLFTDGIIEVEGERSDYFGIEGLRHSVRSNLAYSGESLLDCIIHDACGFARSTTFADDVCLVLAEF
jgi:serine phosphatase RsbU (regulator of sigma subunit)